MDKIEEQSSESNQNNLTQWQKFKRFGCLITFVCLILILVLINTKEYGRFIQKKTGDDSGNNVTGSRPLPEWYDRAKIGILIHWGIYSVPGINERLWYHWKELTKPNLAFKKNFHLGFTYQELAPMFRADVFNADVWAGIFGAAGAKYVLLTSKHLDGFTLFPSEHSFSWNSVDIGPHRDLVKELSEAIKNNSMEFGVYYSLYEWYNPLYLKDKRNKFKTQWYSKGKVWSDIQQLANNYNVSIIWSEGDWVANSTYWDSSNLLSWLYNKSPVKNHVVVNDRWGRKGLGDFISKENYNPGYLQKHKWENVFSLDTRSWGYRKSMRLGDILTLEKIVKNIVITVSCGGNALINVGVTSEGTIPAIFHQRLMQLSQWLSVNGQAIYGTSPWTYQRDSLDSNVWYTCNKTEYNVLNPTAKPRKTDTVLNVFAIILKWPKNDVLILKDIVPFVKSPYTRIEMFGVHAPPQWNITDGVIYIQLIKAVKYFWWASTLRIWDMNIK